MIDDMTLRGMAAKTQDGYVRAVAGLAGYYHRSPDRIRDREVQAYILYLMRERKLSWSKELANRNEWTPGTAVIRFPFASSLRHVAVSL